MEIPIKRKRYSQIGLRKKIFRNEEYNEIGDEEDKHKNSRWRIMIVGIKRCSNHNEKYKKMDRMYLFPRMRAELEM